MGRPPIVSICSPVHNEEGNLSELIKRMRSVMNPRFGGRWEYVLVNDGSTDLSGELLQKLADELSEVRPIDHEINKGERAAWSTAFAAARGEVIVMLAADLQSPPEDVPALIDVLLVEGYDVGTGWRRQRRDGRYYSIATFILNSFFRIMFGLAVKDVSSSFFAVRRRFIDGIPLIENDHRYILPILRRRGASIREIPINHRSRVSGQSHYAKSKVLKAIPEVTRFSIRLVRGYYTRSHPLAHHPDLLSGITS